MPPIFFIGDHFVYREGVVLENFLTISLIGSVMIFVIILMRAVLHNRVHRTVFLLLWLLAAVRLAIPTVISSSVSVYNLFSQKDPEIASVYEQIMTEPVASISLTEENNRLLPTVNYTVPDRNSSQSLSSIEPSMIADPAEPVGITASDSHNDYSVNVGRILMAVWAIGCVGCMLYFLFIHIRARMHYRFAIGEEGPSYLGKIRLKRSDEVSSPIVYGFFRPVILLPYDFPKKNSPEYDQVLLHEVTHVRSGDLWYKLFMLLVTCVHWYNPLVWIMLRLSTQDLEIRCDARVIRKLGKKKDYAMTLVQAEIRQSTHFAEAAFAFSLTELRLNAIAKAKVYLPRSIAIFALLSVILVCCFSTGPKATAVPEEDPAPTELVEETVPTEPVTEPVTEPTVEAVAKAVPTLSLEKEEELPYLQACGFEEYGSVMEISMVEGQKQTIPLKLPEYTTFSVSPHNDIANVSYEYSHDEDLYYLTVDTYDNGECSVYASVAGYRWMEIHVRASFDLYYSVPDAWKFEEYGVSRNVYMTEGQTRTYRLKLPARTVCESAGLDPYFYREGREYTVSYSYDFEAEELVVKVHASMYGWIHLYFYVDGLRWYELDVGVGYKPASNVSNYGYSGNYSGTTTNTGIPVISIGGTPKVNQYGQLVWP